MMSTTAQEVPAAAPPLTMDRRTDPFSFHPAQLGDAVAQLRELGRVEAAMAAAPAALADAGHITRVLVSRIEGSLWVPQHWHPRAPEREADREMTSRLTSLRLPLNSSLVETQVVRRKSSQLVSNAQTDSRANHLFISTTRSRSYVVAPVVVGEDTIALLHADHGDTGRPVSEIDHAVVRHFADLLGIALESIALDGRVVAERDQLRSALARAEAVLSPISPSELSIVASVPIPQRRPLGSAAHPWGLSDREADVLTLMTDGLTNREIAERLFVSESTIKSHIKHIFRKQGVTTRSESIAHAWRRGRRQELWAS